MKTVRDKEEDMQMILSDKEEFKLKVLLDMTKEMSNAGGHNLK